MYIIQVKIINSSDHISLPILIKKTTPSLNVALRDLKPFTNYSIRVAAFTAVGEGVFSDPNSKGIKGATSGASTLIISWKPPKEPNGNVLTYTINIEFSNGLTKITVHHPISHYTIEMDNKNQNWIEATVAASTRLDKVLQPNLSSFPR
ncbi:Phosphatidylinositol phosphatase PTPRQ [Armadillidium vulgare]|nr:Phosphatidylinositol phosphatase PTPRQ [Armadillidium vulgare]